MLIGNLALSRAIGDFEFKQNEALSPEEQVVTCKLIRRIKMHTSDDWLVGDPDIIDHEITKDDEFFVLACDGNKDDVICLCTYWRKLTVGIWDCMSNQEVVDFVRSGIAQDKTLDTICENMMDNCLADDQTSTGLGYDNMSVMVIAILNGKTEKEWYQWIKEKSNGSSNKTIPAPSTAANASDIPDSTPSKLTTPATPTATTPTTTPTATAAAAATTSSSPPTKDWRNYAF